MVSGEALILVSDGAKKMGFAAQRMTHLSEERIEETFRLLVGGAGPVLFVGEGLEVGVAVNAGSENLRLDLTS